MKAKSVVGISVLAAAMVLSACSKSKNKNNGNDPNKGKVTTKAFSEKYQFELNGCNTEKHEFSSDSQADVKKQLCDALQNEKLNKRCAQPLRKSFFDKKCSGLAWNPVCPTPSTPSQPSNSAPSRPDSDHAKETEIRDALKYVLADSFEIKADLPSDIATFATALSEDMRSCGFSYVGPKCITYHAFAGSYEGTLFDPNGESIFLTDLRFSGIDSQILFAFKVKDDSGISSDEVKVFVKVQNKSDTQTIKEYLESNSVQLISTIKISADFIETSKERLKSPTDLKELYHMANARLELARNQGNYAAIKKESLDAIKVNSTVLGSSNDSEYQMRTMSMVESQIGATSQEVSQIAEALLAASDSKVKQMGASYVLNSTPSRTDLKGLVRNALSHDEWTVRNRSIKALSKASRNLDDEKLIIGMMNDDVQPVRETAYQITNGFQLNGSHLDSLKAVVNGDEWTSRRGASTLIGKIKSPAATAELIQSMSDDVQPVREEVFSQLNKRNFTDQEVSLLKSQFGSDEWTVRKNVATLLSKIGSESSDIALIKQMSDEVQPVREEIYSKLSGKTLKESYVNELANQFSSKEWTVRRNVSTLLGSLAASAATVKLIQNMSDDVQPVREEIVSQLSRRNLIDTHVSHLAKQFESDEWTVRKAVAQLLGKIKTQKALEALLDQLPKEAVQPTKEQITASIAAIRG